MEHSKTAETGAGPRSAGVVGALGSDWASKVIVVTGATQGIGLVTARELGRKGARVLIVARDEKRGAAVRDELIEKTGNARFELLLCDFSSQKQIRALAKQLHEVTDRIDVLVNNAGAIFTERALTEDGIERTFAVNHLGYFLLTTLVLDLLRAAASRAGGARVVNVASRAHTRGKLDLSDINVEKRSYVGMLVYGSTKLANILFTTELAKRLAGDGISVNALHPGVVRTGFGRNTPGIFKFLVGLATPFMITAEEGAETTIYLASSSEVDGVTGKYFDKCKPVQPNQAARDAALAAELWTKSEALVAATAS